MKQLTKTQHRQASVIKNWSACPAVERVRGKVSGDWVFRGTRVPLRALFKNLRDGASIDDFLNWFPGVEREQVESVLDFELDTLTMPVVQ